MIVVNDAYNMAPKSKPTTSASVDLKKSWSVLMLEGLTKRWCVCLWYGTFPKCFRYLANINWASEMFRALRMEQETKHCCSHGAYILVGGDCSMLILSQSCRVHVSAATHFRTLLFEYLCFLPWLCFLVYSWGKVLSMPASPTVDLMKIDSNKYWCKR